MGEVINLNKFRKEKERADKARRAATKRARHGRTKAEKELDAAAGKKNEAEVDGHKIVDGQTVKDDDPV